MSKVKFSTPKPGQWALVVQLLKTSCIVLGMIRTNEYVEERTCPRCGDKSRSALEMFKHIKEIIHNQLFSILFSLEIVMVTIPSL